MSPLINCIRVILYDSVCNLFYHEYLSSLSCHFALIVARFFLTCPWNERVHGEHMPREIFFPDTIVVDLRRFSVLSSSAPSWRKKGVGPFQRFGPRATNGDPHLTHTRENCTLLTRLHRDTHTHIFTLTCRNGAPTRVSANRLVLADITDLGIRRWESLVRLISRKFITDTIFFMTIYLVWGVLCDRGFPFKNAKHFAYDQRRKIEVK